MAEQTVRVTARGDFTQLQRGLKQLQGDLKNVTGEIDRGARKGGFFDDSQIRALDFFGKRFKSTLQELKDAMQEHGHAFERLLSMARNAHGAERDAIQKEIDYRSKIIDQIEEQIAQTEKLYQQRKKDAQEFDNKPSGGSSSSKGGGSGNTSSNHDLGGNLVGKALGGAKLLLGLAGIGGLVSMVSESYRLAYERNTAPLDLAQRLRGSGGRSGGAKDMWDASGNVGMDQNMGYTNAESWQFLDQYSRQAGAPSTEEQRKLMKFGRGYGLNTGEVAGLVGDSVHSGGGRGSDYADSIAGSVGRSGMTPRIVEVMETNNALLKTMNTTLKDGSAKQILAYQTSLDKIGNERGMQQLTGSNGANIISGLGGIFKPGEDNWKWMGIRALQQYNPKKYGKMNLFGLEQAHEDGLMNPDNVAAMSKYVKGASGGNEELQKRIMQKWLTDGGYVATKRQASELWDSTNGLQNFSPDQLEKLKNGAVDSGASYDATRKNEQGQGFLETDARMQAAMAHAGQIVVEEVQKLKTEAVKLLEDANKFMDDNSKVLHDILDFMNNNLVGLATAAGALALLNSLGTLGGISGIGGVLTAVTRLGIPLAIVAAGTMGSVEGFKFIDKFINDGGFHADDLAKQRYKDMQGQDAPDWITKTDQLDPASPAYYRNDPRFVAKTPALDGMTEDQKKRALMGMDGSSIPQTDDQTQKLKDYMQSIAPSASAVPLTEDQKKQALMGMGGSATPQTDEQTNKLKNYMQSIAPTTEPTVEEKKRWETNVYKGAPAQAPATEERGFVDSVKHEAGRFFRAWGNYIMNGGEDGGLKKSSADMSRDVKDLSEKGATAFRGMEDTSTNIFSAMLKSMDTFRVGATGIMLAGMGMNGTAGGGLALASLKTKGFGGMGDTSGGGDRLAIGQSTATSDQLDSKLGGKLGGMGKAFAAAGQKYGLDPTFLAAVAMHETGNGTSSAVNNKNNVGGMMGKNGLMSFGSVIEGIDAMASNLKRNYIDQGLVSVDQIQKKYAPLGAQNDPTDLNSNWTSGVEKYMGILNDGELAKPLQGAGTGDVKTASTKHESTVNVNLTGEGADQLTNLSKSQLVQLIKKTWVEQDRQKKLTNPTKAVMA